MVYCRLISKKNNTLSYAVGSIASDITGLLSLNLGDFSFEITKQPERKPVYPLFIGRMVNKYRTRLEQNDIPDKMSYEI